MNADRWAVLLIGFSCAAGSVAWWLNVWRFRMRAVRYRFLFAWWLALVLFAACLPGCAMFPREQTTRRAEVAWITLDAIDTLQTMQIAKHPECFHEHNPIASALYGSDHPTVSRVAVTNVALALLHPVVSRWLDDGYENASDDTVGLWAFGRIGWHGLSLLGSGRAVLGNFSIGLTPTSANCR